MRRFLRENFHLVWMAPFVLIIAWAYGGLALFLTLASLECLSLGIHQYVHHNDGFFARPWSLTVFGGLTIGFTLVPLLC